MPSKILHYVSIMDRAGEETFIMNVFRSIDRSDIMFDFLVTADREGDYDKEIHALGGIVRHIQLLRKGHLKRLQNFFLLKKYLVFLSGEYSTFHIHTQHAMDAVLDAMSAKLAGFRNIIVHSHSTNTLHHVKAHYLFRPLLNYFPIIRLACSAEAGKWLFGTNGKYEIIKNGIVTERYLFDENARTRIRKKEAWEGRPVIGHVGNFTYPKNHDFLLDIFAAFLQIQPDALLVLVGKGDLMDEVRNKTEKIGISDSVRFLGSRGDVNALYSAFDALVFPSRYEGLPVTLVEAQAADLPCLISDAISTEIDISQSLVRMSLKEDARKWAKCLAALLKCAGRGNMKASILKSGYDIGATVSRLTEIYSEDYA